MEGLSTIIPSGEGLVVNRIPRDGEEDDDGDDGDDASEAKINLVLEDRFEEKIMAPSETVEKENTNELTKVLNSSRKTTTLPIEKSNTKDNNNDEARGKINGTNGTTTTVKSIVFSPNWSEKFESPVGLMGFSPSQTGSNHGLGKKTKDGKKRCLCYQHSCVLVWRDGDLMQ